MSQVMNNYARQHVAFARAKACGLTRRGRSTSTPSPASPGETPRLREPQCLTRALTEADRTADAHLQTFSHPAPRRRPRRPHAEITGLGQGVLLQFG